MNISVDKNSPYGLYMESKARQNIKETILASVLMLGCTIVLGAWIVLLSNVLATH